MAILTSKKQTFYEFRNKVDLKNRETFGYFPSGEAMNNELYVFLNKELYREGYKTYNPDVDPNVLKYPSKSITNHNIGEDKDINKDYIQYLLKDTRVGGYQWHVFYDTSLFDEGIQPTLTDYLEYRGDIFELFERTNQLTGPKTDREQAVKDKHIEWYDVDYLKEQVGITRVSKYIFNPSVYSDQWDTEYNTGTHIISRPNEYYRITTTNEAITNGTTEKEISLYLTSNSNSLRPPRIYYKKITTQTDEDEYEHKFIYPYYLGGTLQLDNSGMNVIEDIDGIVHEKFKGNKIVYEVGGGIPSYYVQVSSADFDSSGNYIGTEEYIILPADKTSVYKITNINVKGVATNGDYLTNATNMFNGHNGLYLEVNYLDTSNVTNMNNMFYNSQATVLDLSSFDTSNVTDMSRMFYNSRATVLDLSSFDTSNVTNMNNMFYNSRATTLDLSSFDTSNVTNMSYMFYNSQATVLDLSSFDTSNVTDMSRMFYNSRATVLDLSSFDTSNVTNMNNMFYNSRATTLDLSSFDTSNVTNMNNMFNNSQATTGYARTQTDADKFNSSSGKPITLIFVVK